MVGQGVLSESCNLRGERSVSLEPGVQREFWGRIENKACYSCGEGKTLEDGNQSLGQARV